jgi:glutamine synthetase
VLGSRMEYRGPDASCNPYLSHAVIASAVREGIEQRLSPGPALDSGESSESPFGDIPRTLAEALEAMHGDAVVESALPPELRETFVELKIDEWERACAQVTDWDREMYLHYVP